MIYPRVRINTLLESFNAVSQQLRGAGVQIVMINPQRGLIEVVNLPRKVANSLEFSVLSDMRGNHVPRVPSTRIYG